MSYDNIKINIPKYPKLIVDTLKEAGFDAYIVGGCVRDYLLGETASDYDITTNAKPDDIKKLFKKTIDTGIKHGTVSVLFYEKNVPLTYEVTTYRIDGTYRDGRHPEEVTFVDDLKEDLRRRDFTVNAMAYNDDVGLVDNFGGIDDLKNKIIRAVGDPYERFNEDGLRLLRAIRFAAKLGFNIEEETKNAIPKLAKNLSNISKERVQVELTKTITSSHPEYVKLVFSLGLAKYICDGFENIHITKIETNLSTHLAYACLLYDEDKANAYKILKELKLDNNTISKVTDLIGAKKIYIAIKKTYKKDKRQDFKTHYKGYTSTTCSEYEVFVKELIESLGFSLTYDFLKLIDIKEDEKSLVDDAYTLVSRLEKENTPIKIKDIDIDGSVLKAIGYDGEEIGFVLNKLKEIVHKYPAFNEKKLLQEMAKIAYNIYKG